MTLSETQGEDVMADESLQPFSSFGELLKYHRQRARLTQDEFGLAVGYSRAYLARLESNQRLPDIMMVRARFIEALGLQPGSAAAAQFVGLAVAAHDETPPVRKQPVAKSRANNLPAALTSFVGRECELTELSDLLPTTRLLTLTGAGGTGKTRLALQLAGAVALANRFPDGVWLVELAALTNPALVTPAVASIFGVHDSSAHVSTNKLIAHLKNKRLLLVLDNCEHLVETCAAFAANVLRQCHDIHILATSRETLGIMGELVWRVPSLQAPAAGQQLSLEQLSQCESVQLFVERACFVAPRWSLSQDNAAAVQQICAHLDGIPLAIELAAAQMTALSATDIAARLDDRFRLLTKGNRASLPRHQTLRAMIDWSVNLLTAPEKLLLRRLAVFAGGWTLDAAEQVCADGEIDQADVLGLLLRLVDISLVIADVAEGTRYHLLETIRQYALEVLRDESTRPKDEAEWRARHLVYYTAIGEATQPRVLEHASDADQVGLLAQLWREVDNVRSALEWARTSGRIDDGLRLGHAWFHVFVIRDAQGELLGWLESLITLVSPYGNTVIEGRACIDIADIHARQGEWDAVRAAISRAEYIGHIQEDAALLADTTLWAMGLAQLSGDIPLARSHFEKWRALVIANDLLAEEERLLTESFWCGGLALSERNYVQAEQYFRQHLGLLDPANKNAVSTAARELGYALLHQGRWAEAHPWFLKSLEDNHAIGTLQGVAACIAACGAVALASGDPVLAARLYGAVDAIARAIGTPLMTSDVMEMQSNMTDLRQQLDKKSFNGAWAEGQAMTLEQAIGAAQSATTST